MDFIMNGVAHGDVADKLLACGFNPSVLRPFLGSDGRSYMTVIKNGVASAQPIMNATATLRYEDWKILDDVIVKVAKQRLRAVADLRAAGNSYTIPNGMGKTVLQTETQSDIDAATVSMDGLVAGPNDRPVFELTNLPLPIISKDFSFSARQLEASRSGGSPLDTSTAELAARRVAEMAEQLLIGVASSYTYGGGTLYGYTNFPSRITRTITAPTAVGWTGGTLIDEILAMRQDAYDAYHYGPFMLYNSPAWDRYLDADLKAASDRTLRERINAIEGFSPLKTLDYLTDYDIVMIQMTSDVAREIIGMDITSLQWDSNGGLLKNFKVMAILVPQLRADQNGNTGIVHGSV